MKTQTIFALAFFALSVPAFSANLPGVDDLAPHFTAKNQDGKTFDLNSRKGHWTVLYFYPKSGTPGCTKQACAFRDNLKNIRSKGADVIGISADTVAEQAAFHKEHNLKFELLSDPDDQVINLYGTRMADRKLSKRWTFILDPQLKIRAVEKDVDPVVDSDKMANLLAELQTTKKN